MRKAAATGRVTSPALSLCVCVCVYGWVRNRAASQHDPDRPAAAAAAAAAARQSVQRDVESERWRLCTLRCAMGQQSTLDTLNTVSDCTDEQSVVTRDCCITVHA